MFLVFKKKNTTKAQGAKPANTNLTKLMQTFLQQIPKNSIYIGNEDI